MITNKELSEYGVKGKEFSKILDFANALLQKGMSKQEAIGKARKTLELEIINPNESPISFHINLPAPKGDLERNNHQAVIETMNKIALNPMVKEAAIMPDACPAGPVGVIPVGGVVASSAIHPVMHSADICCSLMISVFADQEPKEVLDTVFDKTVFGPFPRSATPDRNNKYKGLIPISDELEKKILSNRFTKDLLTVAKTHMGTQGDGNHFVFVGKLKSTGQTALVTHHGSRGFGAKLYRKGKKIAEQFRKTHAPDTCKHSAWIPEGTEDSKDYWEALQIVRDWTKENHQAIHGFVDGEVTDRFWNEHNFVFKRNGLYYHAKGATPAYNNWSDDCDDSNRTIIPLNMASPVLIVNGQDSRNGIGFSPHGAGRNYSRTMHKKMLEISDQEAFKRETEGLDIRFYSGEIDTSELPSAYKSAEQITDEIETFRLAKIVDEVIPYGGIMAGHYDVHWSRNKRK